MRWVSCAAVLVACGGAPHATYTATFTDRTIRIESYAKAFRAAEPGMVDQLAFDTRLFVRSRSAPIVDAESGAGPSARAFADPFSFSEREAGIERARETFEHVAADAALQAEWLGARAAGEPPDPLLVRVHAEQASMRRLLDAESARLERERSTAKGDADLLRAVLLGWPARATVAQMRDLESTVAWRLSNVEETLTPNALSAAEREDLRDVLADLAPRVSPMPRAAAAMVKVQHTLDAMWVTPFPTEDEATLDQELALYVGSPVAFDSLDAAFEAAERAFEAQVDAGFSVLDGAARARVSARALEIFARAPQCKPRVPVRTTFDLAPPDERAWSCAMVGALDDARGDEGELAADLAFAEAAVVARWAAATHGPVRAPESAKARAPLDARVAFSREDQARLMRFAQARPWRAIAAGVAAIIVTKAGAARARDRARKWRSIGDAPMDLVDDML